MLETVLPDATNQQHDARLAAAVPLFAATMFCGSALLFLVQPMFAKLALPRLGGSAAVWNTCVLFFQTTLLLGYVYSHFSTRWLGVRRQVYVHLLLLLAPLAALPITAGTGAPLPSASPVWWLLVTMTLTVGLPFFVVSTSAPLLQRWFATLPVPSARDPYFLYAASNLGSMIALIAYPVLLEPTIGTRHQTWLWSGGYVAFIMLTAVCAIVVRTCGSDGSPSGVAPSTATSERLSVRQRLHWVLLAFVPSSLMLGVTTHISTDIAAVPLLWIVPLAIYLGTFVLAFSLREIVPHRWLIRVLPALIFACLLTIMVNARGPSFIPLHLVAFFAVAMVCHRELARRRPDVAYLTEFYIWMSFGGMLGGMFNSLLAPQLFSVILEYPLVLALAGLVRPSPAFRRARLEPVGMVVGVPALVLVVGGALWALGAMPPDQEVRPLLFAFALLLTAAYMFANRAAAFGTMAVVLVGIIAFARPASAGTLIFVGRSFFGVHRVSDAPDHTYHLLQHGSTTHGRQQWPAESTCEQTGYYHPANPIGQLFSIGASRFVNVAVIGLGSGGLACYGLSGDRWTFYEIDPLVERIARDPRLFTHLQNSRAHVEIVLGDGRLSLQRAAPASYDLIVLDAFSSDAIPVHVLTREAIALYFSRLAPDGVLAVHISNRYLNLELPLAALAKEDGLFALAKKDVLIPAADEEKGRFPSHWVMLARTPEPLALLDGRPGWQPPEFRQRVRPWTDDYSNILQVLRRK